MKKDKIFYMSLNYPVQIEKVPEGICAFIPMLKGCKAFGLTPEIALKELEAVKEGFFDVFLEMGKPIPGQKNTHKKNRYECHPVCPH